MSAVLSPRGVNTPQQLDDAKYANAALMDEADAKVMRWVNCKLRLRNHAEIVGLSGFKDGLALAQLLMAINPGHKPSREISQRSYGDARVRSEGQGEENCVEYSRGAAGQPSAVREGTQQRS